VTTYRFSTDTTMMYVRQPPIIRPSGVSTLLRCPLLVCSSWQVKINELHAVIAARLLAPISPMASARVVQLTRLKPVLRTASCWSQNPAYLPHLSGMSPVMYAHDQGLHRWVPNQRASSTLAGMFCLSTGQAAFCCQELLQLIRLLLLPQPDQLQEHCRGGLTSFQGNSSFAAGST